MTWLPETKSICPSFIQAPAFTWATSTASQGDTEFTGTAAETNATVRLSLELAKGKTIPFMRIEKPASIVAVHAYRPLEVAVETATFHLMDWLVTDYGFTATDAYCLVSVCPGLPHQRLSDVQAGEVELRSWGRDSPPATSTGRG